MPITRTNMIDDDGSGTSGTILNNAWKQALYQEIDNYVGGAWNDVPYNAANFVASGAGGGAWAVPAGAQTTLAWARVAGNVTLVQFAIGGVQTLSATATFLTIHIPNVPGPTRPISVPFVYWLDTGASGTGTADFASGGQIKLTRDIGGTPWPAFTTAYLLGEAYIATA